MSETPARDDAPKVGCLCEVCRWCRSNAVLGRGPIKPTDEAWGHLLQTAGAARMERPR